MSSRKLIIFLFSSPFFFSITSVLVSTTDLVYHRVYFVPVFHSQSVRCVLGYNPLSLVKEHDLALVQAVPLAVRTHKLLQGSRLLYLENNLRVVLYIIIYKKKKIQRKPEEEERKVRKEREETFPSEVHHSITFGFENQKPRGAA